MNKTLWTSALALSLSTTACTDDAASMAPPAMQPPQPVEAGALDPSFGMDGVQPLDIVGYASDLALQGDKIVACATHHNGANFEIAMRRVGLDGAVDESFGSGGTLTFAQPQHDVTCERLYARGDGSLALQLRFDSMHLLVLLDANGSVIGDAGGAGSPTFGAVTYQGGALRAALVSNNARQVLSIDTKQVIATAAPTGTVDHVFEHEGTLVLPGAYTFNAVPGWSVMTGPLTGSVEILPYPVASAGKSDVPDLLHDSLFLPDGRVFAVGGVDTDLAVMTTVLGGGAPVVETHLLGETSVARAAVLDGANRPVVVGGATINGVGQYMWQRYDAATFALDATYGSGGVVASPAPGGSGELVAAVRANGAIYALATNGLEATAPSVALVKIAE